MTKELTPAEQYAIELMNLIAGIPQEETDGTYSLEEYESHSDQGQFDAEGVYHA